VRSELHPPLFRQSKYKQKEEEHMKTYNWKYFLFVILLGIGISGCAPRQVMTSTIGAIDSKERLLIATQESEFKDAVLSKLVKGFEKENIFIEVIDLANLSSKSTDDYRAIVIINDYRFFQINQHTRQFLENVNEYDRKKVVLLTTAGSPHLMLEETEVDAISSASKNAKADSVSEMIIKKVNTILSE